LAGGDSLEGDGDGGAVAGAGELVGGSPSFEFSMTTSASSYRANTDGISIRCEASVVQLALFGGDFEHHPARDNAS
jgi:hypothetical protein